MGKYQETDPVKLADAISLVKNGTCGLREAARRFGIPKSTLSDHANGKIIAGSRPAGRRPDLPSHVEDALSSQCIEAAEKGMGVSRQQLAIRIARITNRLAVRTRFTDGIPGKKWITGFRARHPELSLRKPQKISGVRAAMMNRTVTEKYFEASETIITTLFIFLSLVSFLIKNYINHT